MAMVKAIPCEIEGCPNPAKWALFKTLEDGSKKWLNVCDKHEENIGYENLRRAGGHIKK